MTELYRIVRLFHEQGHREIVAKGLTLEQAKAHCCDPETSSSTCTGAVAKDRTARYGAWFDGYEKDPGL